MEKFYKNEITTFLSVVVSKKPIWSRLQPRSAKVGIFKRSAEKFRSEYGIASGYLTLFNQT